MVAAATTIETAAVMAPTIHAAMGRMSMMATRWVGRSRTQVSGEQGRGGIGGIHLGVISGIVQGTAPAGLPTIRRNDNDRDRDAEYQHHKTRRDHHQEE